MDHRKGAGTTEPAPVGPAGDAGPITPHQNLGSSYKTENSVYWSSYKTESSVYTEFSEIQCTLNFRFYRKTRGSDAGGTTVTVQEPYSDLTVPLSQ